jgi:medium-chain acyl-[acyl-carrier-protein] hydrolase
MSDRPVVTHFRPVFTADSRWVRRVVRPRPAMRLICLPFAGGGASVYQALAGLLPPSIEVLAVQLPGREDRTREDPPDNLPRLVSACAVALRPYVTMPYAIYGHCAGGLLAYEVAHELGRRFRSWPTQLVAAAQPAPHRQVTRFPLHELPDERLLEVIRERGGLPAAVERSPELVDMLLPLLRSDFALWENYEHRPRGPLPCPVTTVRGRDDDLVEMDDTKPWGDHSSAGWSELLVEGGHYFINTIGQADANALADLLLTPPATVARTA